MAENFQVLNKYLPQEGVQQRTSKRRKELNRKGNQKPRGKSDKKNLQRGKGGSRRSSEEKNCFSNWAKSNLAGDQISD